MADDTDARGWSQVAGEWSARWGGFARAAQLALVDAAGIHAGARVLDVGCGSGEFLGLLRAHGASAVGIDPAAGMREIAAAQGHDVRAGDAEDLPFPDGSFDVVTAVNALQFAQDTPAALREFARVLRTGGVVAVANWAGRERNDIDVIERAIAAADESEPPGDDPLHSSEGQHAAFADAGLTVRASGIVLFPWRFADDAALLGSILLGESSAFAAEMRPVVLEAAAPFRDGDGYVLHNAFVWVVGSNA